MIGQKTYHPSCTCWRISTAAFGILVFVLVYIGSHHQSINYHVLESHDGRMSLLEPMETASASRCPGVLRHMTRGRWKTRQLSSVEQKQAELLFHVTLVGFPKSIQRPDGRCGDIGYANVSTVIATYLRAICNPTGPSPCCFNSMCVKMDEQQCQCKNCVDARQQIHPEYSTWVPNDDRCTPRQFSSNQSCGLLDGGSVYFIGDSLIRHFYTGFLMTLRGNFKDGALKKNETDTWKMKCSGMKMFEEKYCRERLDSRPNDVCEGSVNIYWKRQYHSRDWQELLDDVTDTLTEWRTLFVVGIGIHDLLNTQTVQETYLQPTLSRLKRVGTQWPKIVFVDNHAPGIIRRPDIQGRSGMLRFNQEMERFLKMYDIPVLKTFDMTDGVWSFDGTHYALGVNRLKVNVLLSYIQELRDGGQW